MAKPDYFSHKKAIVETRQIGKGTRIWAFAHVCKNAVLGENCNIGEGCFIESNVTLGNNCVVKNGVALWDGISADDNVFIGPNAVFTNDLYPRSKQYAPSVQTFLRKGCSIGANATILCGITIGEFALIGAGSVVTEDVPAYTLVYGAKALKKGYVCQCGRKLKLKNNQAKCSCGRQFRLSKGEAENIKEILNAGK